MSATLTSRRVFIKKILVSSKDHFFFSININYDSEYKYIRIHHKNEISKTKIIPHLSLNSILSVYPNPVQQKLFYNFFEKPADCVNISLYNTKGTLILSEYCYFQKGEINLQNIPKGIYFLNYTTQNKVFTKKIIKL